MESLRSAPSGSEQRTPRRGGLLANDVVDIHCDVTGAPRSFVSVLDADDDEGRLDAGQNALVFGTIRAGRNDAQKHEIAQRLTAALAERAATLEGWLRDHNWTRTHSSLSNRPPASRLPSTT